MEEIGPIELGSFPIAVYGVMFGATMAGQFIGVALDSAIGQRALWVPIACSVLLEAVAGAFFATSRVARKLGFADWGRLSAYYSVAMAAVTAPLALWTAAAKSPQSPLGGHDPSALVGIGLGVLVVWTLLRWGLMIVVAPRSRRG